VRFTSIVLADGTRLPIHTETVMREGDSPGRESTAKIGGGAIGGAIIGGLLGGAKGAAIGSTIGAGAGGTAVMAGGRNPATLTAGSPVTVRLEDPVTVTVERQ
jgi:outer membrane lipoprotein SlyB